jgi:hypothetical protein
MKTAIITGASAGLGVEFVKQLQENFPEVESVWLVARRVDRLEQVASQISGIEVRLLPLDLCDSSSFEALHIALDKVQPEVTLLVNNAGCGYLANLGESSTADQTRMVDLNIRALTAVSNEVIPYMIAGSNIINVSSIASFCPNPRMTVYSSSKAYVSAFTRGLSDELREREIGVTAVCPGPMKTEFLDAGGITGNSKMFETLPYCDPQKVVAGVYSAAKAGKVMYTPRAFFKFYRFVAKILPHALVVKWART